ncbi:hypothetical protein EDF24_0853 [Curtobacterium sp. PhB130]|uniref:hypothetical protein n=1 Tax=unclassified Curtobacterium TaxID=257496 RepID=UPI000F4C4759|nr:MULTISPECIES: hypothetical protein [unclassified Curtobacterium]ROS78083.1 hypothetical protein EDF24_0853 [Curtobacterium sp. PhB130]TCK65600.1 hypothetical protein EDF27_0340 [Curtobacterium sp. PhB136]
MTVRPRRAWTHATLWLGLLALVVGVVVAATAPPASFGWFAYAPLSDYAFVAGSTNWHFWTGVAVAVLGAVVAAFAAGRLTVRRSR